jgi:predicted transposase YdaD
MALYPLCRHGRRARQAVSFAASAIQAATADTIVRADLLTTLAIFGRLAYRQLDSISLIGREQMKESTLYEEIKDEGRLESAQADVLAILGKRLGGEAAAQFTDSVHRISKLTRLRRLLLLASDCNNSEDFQRALRAR